jgi:hypothetical protein
MFEVRNSTSALISTLGDFRNFHNSQSSFVYTVIRSCQDSYKFVTCNAVSLHGTLVEAKMFTFTLEGTHFIFNKCPMTVRMLKLALAETKRIYSVSSTYDIYAYLQCGRIWSGTRWPP